MVGAAIAVAEVDHAVLDPKVSVAFGEGAADIRDAVTLRFLTEEEVAGQLVQIPAVVVGGRDIWIIVRIRTHATGIAAAATVIHKGPAHGRDLPDIGITTFVGCQNLRQNLGIGGIDILLDAGEHAVVVVHPGEDTGVCGSAGAGGADGAGAGGVGNPPAIVPIPIGTVLVTVGTGNGGIILGGQARVVGVENVARNQIGAGAGGAVAENIIFLLLGGPDHSVAIVYAEEFTIVRVILVPSKSVVGIGCLTDTVILAAGVIPPVVVAGAVDGHKTL